MRVSQVGSPENSNGAMVVAERLTKRYGARRWLRGRGATAGGQASNVPGRRAALWDCSLEVAAGEVFGLLGPNGAGKTTLIRLLLGYLQATSGSAFIGGFDCQRQSLQVRRITGYLPGEARLFRALRGRDVLRFFSDVRGDGDHLSLQIAERLELDVHQRVAFMSTGMRQKLALAITMASNTPVVILDEPTANLDPTARAMVLALVQEAQQAGRTVLFSSHVLAEVEEVCDRVVILRDGEVVHQQAMSELRRQHRLQARTLGELPPIPSELQPWVTLQRDQGDRVVLWAAGELGPLFDWLARVPLAEIRIEPVGLRPVYDRFHGRTARQPAGVTDSQR